MRTKGAFRKGLQQDQRARLDASVAETGRCLGEVVASGCSPTKCNVLRALDAAGGQSWVPVTAINWHTDRLGWLKELEFDQLVETNSRKHWKLTELGIQAIPYLD